jgi:hypothetical protein
MTTEPTATTTTEYAPTHEALASAQNQLADAEEQLRTLPVGHPAREGLVERKIAAYDVILKSRGQTPTASASPTAGQMIDARAEVKALQATLRSLPEGHREADVILQRLQELSRITQADHPLHVGPRLGAFTAEDVRTAAKAAGIVTREWAPSIRGRHAAPRCLSPRRDAICSRPAGFRRRALAHVGGRRGALGFVVGLSA